MVIDYSSQKVSNKLLTLATVNVFQPVGLELLVDKLQSSIDAEQLSIILDELVSEHRIALENKYFRVTKLGYRSILPDKGRILRDIYRMQYLADVNLIRGGGK